MEGFFISPAMTPREVGNRIDERSKVLDGYSTVKKCVIAVAFAYTRERICVYVFKKDSSRYSVLTSIVTNADVFNDMHYLAFCQRELLTLPSNSTLRCSALPVVQHFIKTLVAPSVSRMHRVGLGLSVFGLSGFLAGFAPALLLLLIGVFLISFAEFISRSRLERSLDLKIHSTINSDDKSNVIEDGLQDELAAIENAASNLFRRGLTQLSKSKFNV